MSKTSEKYAEKLAQGQTLVERGEWDEDSRAERDAINAELAVLRADLDAENALVERSNAFSALAAGGFAPVQFGAQDAPTFEEVVRAVYTDDAEVLRAITMTTTSDIPGLLNAAAWGAITSFASVKAKVWDSFDAYPLTESGLTFTRVYEGNIPGASVHVENTDVASQVLTADSRVIAIEEIAFGYKLSKLAIDRSDPQLLAIAQKKLIDGLTRAKEVYAVTKLVAASTNVTTLSASATYTDFRKAVVKARLIVEGRTGYEANRLYLAADRFEYVMGLADSTGRPMLPNEGPSNADGHGGMFGTLNIAGAEVVISPSLPSGYWSVAASSMLEKYQASAGFMQTEDAGQRNVTVSLGEYVATCLWAEGVQKFA